MKQYTLTLDERQLTIFQDALNCLYSTVTASRQRYVDEAARGCSQPSIDDGHYVGLLRDKIARADERLVDILKQSAELTKLAADAKPKDEDNLVDVG